MPNELKLRILEHERDMLREEYKEILKIAKRLQKENEELKFYIDSYRQTWEVDKYRQALEEIKRMVKGHKIADEARLQVIEGLINKVLESEGE